MGNAFLRIHRPGRRSATPAPTSRHHRQSALPTARPASVPLAAPVPASASPAAAPVCDAGTLIPVPPAHPLPVGPAAVMALSPDRYKLQLTIGGDTLEKLRLAKDMLGHAIPSGDDAAILDRALTALLVELAKKKFSDTRHPHRPDVLGGKATVDQIQLRCRRHNDYEGRPGRLPTQSTRLRSRVSLPSKRR